MSQLYEKKCDCKYYDDGATLLKMELPEYEPPGNGSSYIVSRTLRFMGYVTVMVLLSYSLWRIHVIESSLAASDRLHNLTRTIALESSRLNHNRVTRSVPIGHHADVNSLGTDKDLPRGSMLTAKNEFVPAKRRRPVDEQEFEYLVKSLLDKIQTMHNDSDRSHLGRNMKALFQAWFPVFDSLVPEELVDDEIGTLASITGSVKDRPERSVDEEHEGIKSDWQKLERNFSVSKERMNSLMKNMEQLPTGTDEEQGISNEESVEDKSSEMKEEQWIADHLQEILDTLVEIKRSKQRFGGRIHRLVRSVADKTSEESSEEKKPSVTEAAADKASEESSEEKKPKTTRSVVDKTSEESSEDKKQRFVRSVSMSSDESKSSSEEEKRRVKYNKNNKSKESSEEEEKKEEDKLKKEKSSEESIGSSESAESKEKKDKGKNELFYQVVSLDQDGSKTIVQVD